MRIQDLGNDTVYAPWQDFVDEHRHRNITLLCADASDHQLTFLKHDYVSGLAGQLPYDMGIKSIDVLWTLLHNPESQLADEPGGDFIGTNVVWHVHIPLNLPPVNIDLNRIGSLKYLGYALFTVVATTAVACAGWVYVKRNVRVVQVSQPNFLIMIVTGVIIMVSSILPLSMDDFDGGGMCPDGAEVGFADHCRVICMSIPWLASIGFTTVFAALYSKLRRVNRLFTRDSAFSRVRVSEKDVLKPFFVLLVINVTILICWTAIDPLTYQRQAHHSRDEWNRVISTYGICKSELTAPFLVPLIIVNLGVLIMATWQSYQTRNFQAEFAGTFDTTIT